jgi:hypothetical protein
MPKTVAHFHTGRNEPGGKDKIVTLVIKENTYFFSETPTNFAEISDYNIGPRGASRVKRMPKNVLI